MILHLYRLALLFLGASLLVSGCLGHVVLVSFFSIMTSTLYIQLIGYFFADLQKQLDRLVQLIISTGFPFQAPDALHVYFRYFTLISVAISFFILIDLGKRILQKANEGLQNNIFDHRPPIIYLRAFRTDNRLWNKFVSGMMPRIGDVGPVETGEASLARVLQQLGPMIAVLKPGEWLPSFGITKIHSNFDDWQEAVSDLIAKAQLVVIRIGSSPGLLWEAEHVLGKLNPAKVVLYHPSQMATSLQRNIDYESFCEHMRKTTTIELPKTLNNIEMVGFDENWSCQCLATFPSFFHYFRGFCAASWWPLPHASLSQWLKRAGIKLNPPKVSFFEIVNFPLAILLLPFVALVYLIHRRSVARESRSGRSFTA